jgi:CheY-like chemotaxis protein
MTPAAINLRQRRVLIVDDDRETIDLLTFALDRCGAIVASATTARAALDVLKSWVPDIIVSDFVMPDDGVHLAARAKELHIPAIAITGLALPKDQQRILASGFDLCVTKPFDPEELCRSISTILKTTTT